MRTSIKGAWPGARLIQEGEDRGRRSLDHWLLPCGHRAERIEGDHDPDACLVALAAWYAGPEAMAAGLA